jgi:2-aminoadipate transaminase
VAFNPDRFLSAEGARLRESAIRKMGALLAQSKDLVSFAPGYPAEDLFPWAEFQEVAAELLGSKDGRALQYGATRGYRPLLETIVELMKARGISTGIDNLLVTSGSQQGLDLLGRVLCDPGDVVLMERPSYSGAISALENIGASLVGVPQASDGVDLDALSRTLKELRSAGRKVKAFYTVPNFQNPTGLMVSLAKRSALLEWAAREDMLIIEDDPYRDIYFEDVTTAADTRPIAADDTEGRVIYLSSFSKTLAPGFRTAWISAPAALTARLEMLKQSADLCTAAFDQRMINGVCRKGIFDAHLPRLRAAYGAKRDVMARALTAHLGDSLKWSLPRGGFFLWTRLPTGLTGQSLLPFAIQHGVIYVSGEAFFVAPSALEAAGETGEAFIRLAFSSPSHERIEEGVRRLASAIGEASRTSGAASASAPARESSPAAR